MGVVRVYQTIDEVFEDYKLCPNCIFSYDLLTVLDNDSEIRHTKGCLIRDDRENAEPFDESDCCGLGAEVPEGPKLH